MDLMSRVEEGHVFCMLRQTPSYFVIGGVIAMLISALPLGTFDRAYLFYGGLICVIYGVVGVLTGKK